MTRAPTDRNMRRLVSRQNMSRWHTKNNLVARVSKDTALRRIKECDNITQKKMDRKPCLKLHQKYARIKNCAKIHKSCGGKWISVSLSGEKMCLRWPWWMKDTLAWSLKWTKDFFHQARSLLYFVGHSASAVRPLWLF